MFENYFAVLDIRENGIDALSNPFNLAVFADYAERFGAEQAMNLLPTPGGHGLTI